MGVGGKFWDVLKPYARSEGMDFVRDKRVAVDLSFWIVQHDSAIRGAYMKRSAGGAPRNPHIRVTFFRTVNLFAKMGAYPVFVVDGEPPRMKAQARVERFCRASGLDPSALGLTRSEMDDGDGPVVQRNRYFTRCVQECVELLELLGMPILRATSEAEALCAQLNIEGQVDACITADSDAFLFGAKCVIKCLHSNSKVDKHKLQKKQENWRVRVCQKISTEQNFPNDKIIEIYLNNNANHNKNGLSLLWENPEVDALVDFMAYYQNWKPSYTRQRLLPMLTTIFLREMASNPKEGLLLCGQYEFHSIQRMKIRFSHPFCVVKWKRVSCSNNLINEQPDFQPEDTSELNELNDLLDEPDVPLILIDDGCWFMATDEHMELVKTAFPKEVDIFLKEKELKESKSRRGMTSNKPDSSKSTSVQLSITEFYRSSKIMPQPRPGGSSENVKGLSREKQKMLTGSDQSLSKSARRRRLFG
uniref:Flap endonuclease GEN-like 1 n=1 Tax=Anthurium amnicola TaxID=1678845 RepID=A0A1D1Y663_9ARAE